MARRILVANKDQGLWRRLTSVANFGPRPEPFCGDLGQPTALQLTTEGDVCFATQERRCSRFKITQQKTTILDALERIFELAER